MLACVQPPFDIVPSLRKHPHFALQRLLSIAPHKLVAKNDLCLNKQYNYLACTLALHTHPKSRLYGTTSSDSRGWGVLEW
jgi:hypothetical protein